MVPLYNSDIFFNHECSWNRIVNNWVIADNLILSR